MSEARREPAPDAPQLSAVRQRRLLEAVQQRSAMSIRDLCEYLRVSDATIRRDVQALDRKGLLTRTHGGVVANSIVNFDLPASARARLNEEEKGRIGAAAIDMLEGNETVMIDAGTTALSVASYAERKPGCTFVTTSLGVAQMLKQQGIQQHYLIGGAYLAVNDSYCGSIAISTIRTLSFDVALLCASAVDVRRRSISLGNEPYSQIQREIIAVSRKKILVADHSKFRASAFSQTATFDDLDVIVTDSGLEEGARQALEHEELELRLA